MFTRFNYDPARVDKRLQESTDPGKYILNVPGPADKHYYFEDPQIRLTQYGANAMHESMDINNELKGITRPLNRDCININQYKNINGTIIHSENLPHIVDESRSTHPAWELRDDEKPSQFQYLFFDPQEHMTYQFNNNLDTRNLEKDYYKLNKCERKTNF